MTSAFFDQMGCVQMQQKQEFGTGMASFWDYMGWYDFWNVIARWTGFGIGKVSEQEWPVYILANFAA